MKIPLDRNDKISEGISTFFLLACVLIVALSLPGLPDIVPIHFNLKGVPNGYGSKYFMWLGPAIASSMYIGLTVLAKYPQVYNFRYTPTNIEEQYKITSKMVRSIKAGLMFFFSLLAFFLVQSAQLKLMGYIIWLLPIFLIIIFGNVIYYTIQWGKIK
jgi:uncharacterized membrane protein